MQDLPDSAHEAVRDLDGVTCALHVQLPPSQVVLAQAYFEHFEGLAVVRTVDAQAAVISIWTTRCLLPHCIEALQAVRADVRWRYFLARDCRAALN